jgi:ligand-binding sensor protein
MESINRNKYLVDGKYSFKELVAIDRLKDMFEHFSQATGFKTGLVSYPDQELLISTGWRDICTKFHRTYPVSEVHCQQSNMELISNLKERRELNIHHCENGLVDGATSIIIKDAHVANLFTGQILFTEPDIERFRKQGEA